MISKYMNVQLDKRWHLRSQTGLHIFLKPTLDLIYETIDTAYFLATAQLLALSRSLTSMHQLDLKQRLETYSWEVAFGQLTKSLSAYSKSDVHGRPSRKATLLPWLRKKAA
jgi:hypothetical protein